jgi:LPS export ABC transporter protein LptC
MIRYLIQILILAALFSCNKETDQINKLFEKKTRPMDKATNIEMLYSDSAKVLFILNSPLLETKKINNEKIIEYPKGIKISFLDQNKKANSWLTAGKAINKIKDKKFIVSENVKLFNSDDDKLETSELIWDEKNEILYTNKFVKITRPVKGDTLYGYGFRSNKEFTEFEIKRKLSGKVVEDIFRDIK